jgi:mannose-6-phosphate isomerase
LHNDIAIDAIDFNLKDDFRVSYESHRNVSNEMVNCPYFITNFLEINKPLSIENTKDSFMIYMCVDGDVEVTAESSTIGISKGETLLIPALVKNYTLNSNYAKLLEVYV